MKIYDSQNNEFEYNELVTRLDSVESPFKEIINKEDYSSFSFSVSEEKILLSECCVLLVNIKDSASVYFIFAAKDFNKKKITEKVVTLKDLAVDTIDNVKIKTTKLFEIIKEYNPYFVIYTSKEGLPLPIEMINDVKQESGFNASIFYVEYVPQVEEEKPEVIDVAPIEEKTEETEENNTSNEEASVIEPIEKVEEVKDAPKEKKKKKEKVKRERLIKYNFKEGWNKDREIIKKNKYQFIFLFVASFLFGLAFTVGFCNIMVGKMIAVLFFICGSIGVFLNVFIHMDNFEHKHYFDRTMIISIIFNLLGVGLSIGSSVIFYNLDKNGLKDVLTIKKLILFNGGVGVALLVGSIAIAFLVRKLIELKKKR